MLEEIESRTTTWHCVAGTVSQAHVAATGAHMAVRAVRAGQKGARLVKTVQAARPKSRKKGCVCLIGLKDVCQQDDDSMTMCLSTSQDDDRCADSTSAGGGCATAGGGCATASSSSPPSLIRNIRIRTGCLV